MHTTNIVRYYKCIKQYINIVFGTNVIYINNNYMFRPRGAIIRLCNRILNRLAFWWGNLRERDRWGDRGVDGRIMLGWIFKKWDVGV
jgi:hypothetical protein